MYATLEDPKSARRIQFKVGFSWTYFFFGAWVCLFRADWKGFAISVLASCVTLGLFVLIFSFFYNKFYANTLFDKGFVPASDADKQVLVNYNYISSSAKTIDDFKA